MKLVAHIQYKKSTFKTILEFGSEEATIKSLGLMAAQFFVTQNASSRGLLRHRDSLFASTYGSFYLPVDVSRDPRFGDPTLLDPDNEINLYFHEGEDVYVKLLTKVDINSKGIPYVKQPFEHLSDYNNDSKLDEDDLEEVKCEDNQSRLGKSFDKIGKDYDQKMSDWFILAFRKNHMTSDQLEEIRNKNRSEELAAIKRREIFEQKEKEAELSKETDRIRSMFDIQMYSDVRQNHLMDSAWIQMTHYGRLEKIVQDPVEQDLIKQLLLENYILLWETFRKFASIIQDSTTELLKLDLWEFKEFIVSLKLLNAEERESNPSKFDSLVDNIFSECLPNSEELLLRGKRELYSPEFFLSLIHIAHVMFLDVTIQKHLPSLSYTQTSKKRSFLLAYTSRGNEVNLKGTETENYNAAIQNTETSPFTALQRLIKEYLLPYGNRNLQTFMAKHALNQTSILTHFAEANDHLLAAYKKYSYLSPAVSLMQNFMWYKQLIDMAVDCNLLAADFDLWKWSEWPFYVREIRLVLGAILAEGNEQSDLEARLNYPEFLEAIARLSIHKYKSDDRLSAREKIYSGIQLVVQLMKKDKRKGKKQGAISKA